MRLAPPMPEVQYLPMIFRKIQLGEIKIPAFQREFCWNEIQVRELLESLYKGFPIGSLLFWKAEKGLLKIESGNWAIFPEVPESYPLNYVLDGLQRLLVLYGCFHWKAINTPNIYNVVFDLDTECFLHFNDRDMPQNYIHLSSIFSPKDFLEAQRKLIKADNSDKLIDKTINLYSTFQEYLIPTVTISDRNVSEVVEIFERINSTGIKLGSVDFLRAVTWSQEFDLNHEMISISNFAEEKGFKIPLETIVKIFAIALDKDPTPEAMLTLRECNPSTLHEGVKIAKIILLKSLNLLSSKCRIYSYEYMPYEGLLLILLKYAKESGEAFNKNINEVMKWFWSIALNEGLRGKPDSYVVRALKSVEKLVNESTTLNNRITLTAADLLERRFFAKKALSATIASMFAMSGVRSLFTNQIIEPNIFMHDFDSVYYEGFLSLEELNEVMKIKVPSNKMFANLIIVLPEDNEIFHTGSSYDKVKLINQKFGDKAQQVFESQWIPLTALEHLHTNNYMGFLQERSQYMINKIADIVNLTNYQLKE